MVSRSPIHVLALAALMLGAGESMRAQVASKSPFMPPQAAGNAPTAGAPLELRGVLEVGGAVKYRIYDPARKVGTWISLNEKNAEFDVVAKQYDASAGTLTIEHQGKTITLAPREPKVVSSGVAGQTPPPPLPQPALNVAPAVTQSVVLNPTPADEQRRLDAVAAEVARRRALREQAAQQVGGAATPAPQTAPAPAVPGRMLPVPQVGQPAQPINPRTR